MGAKQSIAEMSQLDVQHAAEELELLAARATALRQTMVSRGLEKIWPKKVAARERGYTEYAAFLDGIEKAILYPPTVEERVKVLTGTLDEILPSVLPDAARRHKKRT